MSSALGKRLAEFLQQFELVFDDDWEFSQTCLGDDNRDSFVADGGTFLNPGVRDEANNWGNRGSLLRAYRHLVEAMADDEAEEAEKAILEPGFWVALTLRANTAPLRSYAGKVQSVDAQGVRVTLVDWVTGTASDWDLFVPWHNLESALVATPDHATEVFGEAASRWQTQMEDGPDAA
jgi:hypothetical protein